MLKYNNQLKCQGHSRTYIWKSSAWNAAIACGKSANKIGADVDMANTTIKFKINQNISS